MNNNFNNGQYVYYIPNTPPVRPPYVKTPEGEKMKKDIFRNASYLGILLILYNVFNRLLLNVFYIACYIWFKGSISFNLDKVKNYLVTEQADYIQSSSFSMTGNLFVVALSTILLMIVAVFIMKIDFRSLVKPEKASFRTAVKWAPLCITFNLLVSLVIAIFVQIMSQSGVTVPEADFTIKSPSTYAVVMQLLYVCIIGPVVEELIYRALIIRLLSPFGKGLAIFFSALIFGLMHGNIPQAASAFAGGMIYAMVTVYSGSIIPSILIHIINNCFASITDIGNAINFKNSETVYYGVVILLFFAGIYGLMVYLRDAWNQVKSSDKTLALPSKKRYAAVFSNVFLIIYFCFMLWEYVESFISSNS